MAAREESERRSDEVGTTENAVERSLEDFIARAHSTLPPPEPETAAAMRSRGRHRAGFQDAGGTLVVLGSQQPLAEVTEIVSRLPAADLAPPRRFTSLRFGVIAFLAGAAAVLILTRLLGGGPRPLKPVAVPVPAPTPPIVVQPIPAAELPPAPAAIPPAATQEPAPIAPAAAEARPAAAPEPPRRSRAAERRAPARKATRTEKPRPTGLVDPFAP